VLNRKSRPGLSSSSSSKALSSLLGTRVIECRAQRQASICIFHHSLAGSGRLLPSRPFDFLLILLLSSSPKALPLPSDSTIPSQRFPLPRLFQKIPQLHLPASFTSSLLPFETTRSYFTSNHTKCLPSASAPSFFVHPLRAPLARPGLSAPVRLAPLARRAN
jgi:hypothetical protein